MSALWININRNGGLGNRLFARAHVYAAAREFGATVADWGLIDQARHFPALAGRPLPSYPLAESGAAPDLPTRWWLDPKLLGLARRLRPRRTGRLGPIWSAYWGSGNVDSMALDGPEFRAFATGREVLVLDGYKLRCVPWLRKHADEVRRYFAPPQVLAAKWAALQDAWHQRWERTVAVHMRATDFRHAQGGRFYLTPSEYADALRARAEIDLDKTLFVLFSDEDYLGKVAFDDLSKAYAGLNHVFMHGSVLDDLVGIGSCDWVVGPASSTFSRWAAFAQNRRWAGVSRPQNGAAAAGFVVKESVIPWDY